MSRLPPISERNCSAAAGSCSRPCIAMECFTCAKIRKKTCFGNHRPSNPVAGGGAECRRSGGRTSQVLVLTVAGLRRRQKVSQVRLFLQTCDVSSCHLRRFFVSPATFPSVTCDSYCHLRRLITADRESEAAFHHEADGMDGKTVNIGPAHACEIVAHHGVQIYAQPGSDHVLRAGTNASGPLE